MNITKVQDGKKAYDVLTIEGSFDRAYTALKKDIFFKFLSKHP